MDENPYRAPQNNRQPLPLTRKQSHAIAFVGFFLAPMWMLFVLITSAIIAGGQAWTARMLFLLVGFAPAIGVARLMLWFVDNPAHRRRSMSKMDLFIALLSFVGVIMTAHSLIFRR